MVSLRDSNDTMLAGLGFSSGPEAIARPIATDFIAHWQRQTLLRLSGPDARKFLQGQLTCQLDELTEQQAIYGAACTPKGKAIANFRLLQLDSGDILLRVSADLADQVLKHFQKYLAFFKARLEPADGWVVLGIRGTQAHHALEIPEGDRLGAIAVWNRSRVIAAQVDADGCARSELWLNGNDLATLEACLATAEEEGFQAPQDAWLATEIRAGLTTIDTALSERLVPQYFNWHCVDGISFKKGCYTGQEIIARLRYLGQLKKSTYRVTLPRGGAAQLSAINTDEGRPAGEVTNLMTYADGSQEGLAVINHQAARARLYVDGKQEYPVEIVPLPYKVVEQEAGTEPADHN
ncbi:YgfZ/GcvT domain-containing protein [Hydrocarboniclastica marina]|uniref:Folate-binding protein n=1 Tax=Hydrocarboniclastica marina TaxID=2259620 RepID=A0A4P7XF51_9ALTE|nr:folate-binding protein YgfZ [Hydrocarboniclastica marina]MAL99741.1 hypothetical protein [Alteromonadaceae bacterium]QCF25285.1 folate-binding protein [Hydrocarboniclastica marina]